MTRSACLLLIWCAAAAQEPRKCSVEGIVVDEVTGKPIRAGVGLSGVRTDTEGPVSAVVQSQADGRFRFDGLEAGTYHLVGQKSGYFAQGGRGVLPEIELSAGAEKSGVTIRLTPQGIVTGRVVDEAGDPVQGAQIGLRERKKAGGRIYWQTVGGGSTNDRGEYRLLNLRAGEFVVSASYRDPLSQVDPGPGVRTQAYATSYLPVSVRWGGETGGVDLRLGREAVFRVRVQVEGASAGLLQQTNVSLLPRDLVDGYGPVAIGVRATVNGIYELTGVRAGSWIVQAQTGQPGGDALIGTTPIEVTTGDVMDVVVRVGAAPQLTGTLRFMGAPAVVVNWKNFEVRLAMPNGRSYSSGRSTVTEDGAFSVRNDRPGKYLIDVRGPLPWKTYVASIRVGEDEYLGKEIDLTGGMPGPVEIVLRDDAALVSGKLGGTIGGVVGSIGMAVLVPVEVHLRRREFILSAPILTDGSFSFGAIRPGEYLLCYVQGDSHGVDDEGEPPKESMAAAVRLKAEPGGTHTLQLKH